jgi:hypothetical protein
MSYQVLLKKTAMLSQSLQRNLPAPYPPDSNVVTSLCLEGPPKKTSHFGSDAGKHGSLIKGARGDHDNM